MQKLQMRILFLIANMVLGIASHNPYFTVEQVNVWRMDLQALEAEWNSRDPYWS